MSSVRETPTRRTVLVVEDALTTRCILEQFFARAGCDVLQAADPDSARMRLIGNTVDAVILDLRLGHERSGLEVLEQMRLEERLANIPVVILTGADTIDPKEEEIIQARSSFNQQRIELEAMIGVELKDVEGYVQFIDKLTTETQER